MDTWWQTETGGFMITPLPITPLKPGSATKPFFGNEVDVVDESGKSVKTGEEGNLVIKNPWPGMARTILRIPTSTLKNTGSNMKNRAGTWQEILPRLMRTDMYGSSAGSMMFLKSAGTGWDLLKSKVPWSAIRL